MSLLAPSHVRIARRAFFQQRRGRTLLGSVSKRTFFHQFFNVVDGKLRDSPRTHRGIDPSSKKQLWDVPVASRQDLDDAVSAAGEVFPEWSKTPWTGRAKLLREAAQVLEGNRGKMAQLLAVEGGKPIQFGELEVQHALDFLNFYSSQSSIDEKVIQDDKNLRLSLRYTPLGIVGAICPWNYPLVLAMGKIGAALVTGNCVVVKPSPFTPYSILKFAELVHHLFPQGALQVLNGDDTLGPALCTHPNVHKITFTGSIATGKRILQSVAPSLKRVTLELGGNNASIVCSDVDPKIVGPQVAVGSFFNSGQLCVASKRVYVHEDIYDEFKEIMVNTVKSWKVGPTSEGQTGVNMGPVQNEMQYNIVKQFFDDSTDRGFKFALGGKFKQNPENLVIQPAIIDNPPDDSLVVHGEAFGPIVPLLKWKSEDEVIRRVNGTLTGLGGAVWSKDTTRARRLAERIDAGSIWINSFEKPLPQGYFAGRKESGLGGEWGSQGLLAYCHPQAIHHYKSPVSSA